MGVLSGVGSYLSHVLRRKRRAGSERPFRWRKVKFASHVRILRPPNGWRRTLAIRPAEDLASTFFEAVSPPPYRRQTPRVYGSPMAIEADLAKAYERGPITAPAGGTAFLTEVSVLAGGIVATAEGAIVKESLINTDFSKRFGPFFRSDRAAPLRTDMRFCAKHRRLSSDIHILLKQTFDANYGHWLVECLPRLMVAAHHYDLKSCKVIVSDWSHMKQTYVDTLGLFGVEPDQIVEVGYESVHVERLVYPLPITSHRFPYTKSPRVVDVLEAIPDLIDAKAGQKADPTSDFPRRLYVSRNRYHKRRLLNEEAVLEHCASLGFDVIYPELMSFADQVRAFSRAEIVVGNCGAALTNIAFSPRGCTLFALASEYMHDGFFWDLASLKDITYVSLHGKAATDPKGLTEHARLDIDFEIDIGRFASLLADLLKDVDARQGRTEPWSHSRVAGR